MIVYFAMLTFVCFLALWSVFLPPSMRLVRLGVASIGFPVMAVFIGLRDHVGAASTRFASGSQGIVARATRSALRFNYLSSAESHWQCGDLASF
jgi:hypothetical protein